MQNYFFKPDSSLPVIPQIHSLTDDTFLFNQGATTKGFEKIQFHDYNIAYNTYNTPNLSIFKNQIESFKQLLEHAGPDKTQKVDIDFMLTMGEMFTLVAYGQLILEQAKLTNTKEEMIDQIFDFMIRDFSKYSTQLYSKPSSTKEQQEHALKILHTPILNQERFDKIYNEDILSLVDKYEMNR